MEAFARALTEAEHRLRAAGLTGRDAFGALRDTLVFRLEGTGEPHPALADFALPAGDGDLLGLAYERFFPDLFKGRVGQYFTPRALGELLLSRMEVGPQTTVLDPTCGSGGLLVLAGRRGAALRGLDIDADMVELARLNLSIAGLGGSLARADAFSAAPEAVDAVLANPPFSVPIRDVDTLSGYALAAGSERVASDVLFMEALEHWLRPGGVAGIVVPWTLVANPSMERVRRRVDAHFRRLAICALPEGVFRPFGGAAGRAALLWLQRRPCDDGPMAWAELADPGYDVRSTALKPTSRAEVEALCVGRGWREVPADAWIPRAEGRSGPTLASWMGVDRATTSANAERWVVELADTDRSTGEVRPRRAEVTGRRAVLRPGQVLVSRMRPALGNVALMPPELEALGSPEWIRLEPDHHPHYAWHAMRTPAWRAQLPPTSGQTRPRTDVDSVLATSVPMPPDETLDRIEALSSGLLEQRRRARARLLALQEAIDAFVAGELDPLGLEHRVAELEET